MTRQLPTVIHDRDRFVRRMAQELDVSIAKASAALVNLERRGLVIFDEGPREC